ncbi:MAG TPA: hypothetical protein VMR50_10485 [Myxococcota bacterium]|nr:hypothetical protein [Myxococcota bacterium]
MKVSRAAWLIVPFLGFAPLAHAVTVLSTVPFSDAHSVRCEMMNVSKKDVMVKSELLNAAREVLVTQDLKLASGDIAYSEALDGAWCRFTIENGTAKSIRAGAFINTGTTFTMSVPAF